MVGRKRPVEGSCPLRSVTIETEKPEPVLSMYEIVDKMANGQLEIIRNDLRKKSGNKIINAICLCYDVHVIDPRTNKKTDAVLLELADKETGTTNIYIPYNYCDVDIIKKPFQVSSDQKYF